MAVSCPVYKAPDTACWGGGVEEWSDVSPLSSADIKEHVKQLEKAVSGKEPRFVLRALRMLPSTSRRLNHYVLYKAVHGFFTSNNTTRDFLLSFLEEVSGSGQLNGGRQEARAQDVIASLPENLSR